MKGMLWRAAGKAGASPVVILVPSVPLLNHADKFQDDILWYSKHVKHS